MQIEEGAIIDKVTKLPGVSYGFQKIKISNDHAEVEAVVSLGLFALTIFTYDLVLQDTTGQLIKLARRAALLRHDRA